MKLINNSHIPTSELKPLLLWVASQYFHSKKCNVTIRTAHYQGVSSGMCYNYHTEGNPSFIEIDLVKDVRYPVRTLHRKRAGEVFLQNWREDFVLVLAHELRHNDQNRMWLNRVKQPEVDAEKFAIEVLTKFRKRESKCVSSSTTVSTDVTQVAVGM